MLGWFLLGAVVVSLVVFAVLVKNAPEGFQDENGFHYGRKNHK